MSIIGSQRIDSLGTYFKDFLTKPDNVALIMKVLSSDGSGEYFILPFFPESVSDSKSVNWNNIELPGASHPIYQYVNSGERTISFTAKLLREIKPVAGETIVKSPYNVDINDVVRFLRSCLYPQKSNTETIVKAPPICKIKLGGSVFDSGSGLITCIMTQCDVEVSKWWDDNRATPKVAEVSLAFSEIINVFGDVRYVFSDEVSRPRSSGVFISPE